MKTIICSLMAGSVLFIDALPMEVHAVCARWILPMVVSVAGATYVWLKVHTAEMYSEYDPPEYEKFGVITLSSYQKCCDFLVFQAHTHMHAHAHMRADTRKRMHTRTSARCTGM